MHRGVTFSFFSYQIETVENRKKGFFCLLFPLSRGYSHFYFILCYIANEQVDSNRVSRIFSSNIYLYNSKYYLIYSVNWENGVLIWILIQFWNFPNLFPIKKIHFCRFFCRIFFYNFIKKKIKLNSFNSPFIKKNVSLILFMTNPKMHFYSHFHNRLLITLPFAAKLLCFILMRPLIVFLIITCLGFCEKICGRNFYGNLFDNLPHWNMKRNEILKKRVYVIFAESSYTLTVRFYLRDHHFFNWLHSQIIVGSTDVFSMKEYLLEQKEYFKEAIDGNRLLHLILHKLNFEGWYLFLILFQKWIMALLALSATFVARMSKLMYSQWRNIFLGRKNISKRPLMVTIYCT